MTVIRLEPRSQGLVCDAIRGMQLLAFNYGDGERIIEPHIHGFSAAGTEIVRGYQVSGPSRKGHPNRWRLFLVDRIRDPRLLEDRFAGEREDFNLRDPDVVRAHCHVSQSMVRDPQRGIDLRRPSR